MKYYIAVHKKDYTEEDIAAMVNPVNVQHIYSRQTYWEPGEDYIEFDIDYNEQFHEVVKPMEVHFFEECEEYPYAVVVDGMTYCFNYSEEWEEILSNLGWKLFCDLPLSEEYAKDIEELDAIIENWAYGLCEDKAEEVLENAKYGDF